VTESTLAKKMAGRPPWAVFFNTQTKEVAMAPFTRRLFLGAAAASTVVSPSVASATADPIFAAIDAHRKLGRQLEAVLTQRNRLERTIPEALRQTDLSRRGIVETDSPEWIASEKTLEAIFAAESDAELELAGVVPTTSAGVVALLSYAVEFVAPGNTWPTDLLDDDGRDATWEILVMRNCAKSLANLSVEA
jgi:hypothetical protein